MLLEEKDVAEDGIERALRDARRRRALVVRYQHVRVAEAVEVARNQPAALQHLCALTCLSENEMCHQNE